MIGRLRCCSERQLEIEMTAKLLGGLSALLCVVASGLGATIDVGDFLLDPNTPGQQILLEIQGTPGVDEAQGVTLNVQVADGYPDFIPGDPPTTIDGPNITAVDLVGAGTVFGSVPNTGPNFIEQREQLWAVGTTTASGTVTADGVLAVVTIDTTGWFAGDGPWELRLKETLNGDTTLPGLPSPPTIINGTIAVPEPSALLLGLVGGALFWCWRSRPRRATSDGVGR